MTLTVEHRQWLEEHGVNIDLAESLGVRSVLKPSHLPPEWQKGLGRHAPGVLFPWTSALPQRDGSAIGPPRVSPQLRPDDPPSEKAKYIFQEDSAPVLWAVRPNPGAPKILIVEGSKQGLVAASHAPPDFAVFSVAGCWGYSHKGKNIPDLKIARGLEVYCCFDADAATNADVYGAAERLAKALKLFGAKSVRWLQLAAGGTIGLDDVLADMEDSERPGYLENLIAQATTKPAERRPAKKRMPKSVDLDPERPAIDGSDDALIVADAIETQLKSRYDGKTLFCHGGVLSLLEDGVMHPLSPERFTDLVVKTVQPVSRLANGDVINQLFDTRIMGMVHVARAATFTKLEQVTKLPFVRTDGTICTDPGYDKPMLTYLLPSDDLEDVKVSEHPDRGEVRDAVRLLLDEWLGDMAFPNQASRANALVYLLTPFIRGLVPVVPLAIIDGLQMGVGKGLLANVISLVTTGEPASPKPYHIDDDDENRKTLLGCFRAGEQQMAWDEAHIIQGTNLARAMTAPTYTDRVLGVSTVVRFPNKMTWAALGNQVQVRGDMTRRVYWIELWPSTENPHQRSESVFRHHDLEGWTREHRAELLSACLTLIRAWFAEGSPTEPASLASFEAWERMMRGILTVAEVPGFLENSREKASEGDLIGQWWYAHLSWVHENLDQPFITAEVKGKALADPSGYHAPLDLDDPSDKSYAKKLGEAYSSVRDRWFEGYKLIRAGNDRRGVAKWRVVTLDDIRDLPLPPPPVGPAGSAGTTYPTRYAENVSFEGAHAHTRAHAGAGDENHPALPASPSSTGEVIFDLETGSADDLYLSEKGAFVRLGGHVDPATPDDVTVVTDWKALSAKLKGARVVSGHNIMRFDLPALAHHHPEDAPDIQELARDERVFDTLLAARHLDPPMAKDKGVDARRRHDLDSLGKRLFGDDAGKAGNLKALAKEFGGYDQIPLDDERYITYLRRDVTLNALVYNAQQEALADESEASRAYLAREHRVAAVAAQISLNSFRVDLELLQERLDLNARKRRAALNRLHTRYDIPLEDAKGKPYKAPLATTAGKAALCAALLKAGLKENEWWTTASSRDIALSAEAMKYLYTEFHHIPAVRDIARMVITVVGLRSVYETVEKFLTDDRVHCSISMHQATGRWSTTKPGLTVFGKRGGRHHEREIFLAEPGHVIIAVDLSQVDMRAIAGLSGDLAYIDMLKHEDPHAEIARLLFGDPGMREIAKPIGHGWNYGRGIKAISDSNNLEPKLVRQFDTQMRERFPRLVEWQGEVRALAESGNLLDNGWGRPMRPDPRRAHTQGPALMGQGCARDIMCHGLLRLPSEVLPMLRAQIHDEIVLSVPAADAHDIQQVVIDALSFEWEAPSGAVVPIIAEGGPVDRINWGQVYEKEPRS